jgi:outer membrane protein
MKLKYVLLTACLCSAALFAQSPATRSSVANTAAGTPALRPVPDAPAADPAASPAVTPTGVRIGIINIQEAILATGEGKKAANDLQTRFEPKRTDLDNRAKEIQQLQQKLQDGGNTLSPDAKAELARSIETKQKDYQRSMEDAQSDFNSARDEMVNQIGNKMMQIINDYSQRNGYSLVLDVSQNWPQNPVLFASQGVNITGDIVRLYDQSHPSAGAATTPRTSTTTPRPGATRK